MKKVIKLTIYVLFLYIFNILNVNAASLTFDGDKTISGSNTGSNDIMITVSSEEKIRKVEFSIEVSDSSLVVLNLSKESSLAGEANVSKSSLSIADSESFFTSGKIANLRITNNNLISTNITTKIKITDIVFTNEDGDEINGTDYSKDITLVPGTTSKPKSTNAKLTGLSVSVGNLTPEFNSSETSYKVYNVRDTVKSLTITTKCDMCNVTIKCDSGCTNYLNQNKPELVVGKNILKISTISEDGSNTSEYDLIIYRGETTDNSPFLKDLSVENFTLAEKFDKEELDYTLTVPYETEALNIIATPEDENAKVEIKGLENLIVGENVVTITVTSAETQDKKIYNITVVRSEVEETTTSTEPVVIAPGPKKNNNKTLLIVIISVVCLAIIGLAAYFIFGKKKIKKGKPEKINNKKEKKLDISKTEPEVRGDDLINELNLTSEKTKPSVDDALADLMSTKEVILKEEKEE